MSADQYRIEAQKMMDEAQCSQRWPDHIAERLIACAQVYALLAISAQAAENATDLPF